VLSRSVVVVGAGPGLGAAVARRFAREGFRVGLLARSPDGIDPEGMDLAGPPVTVAADIADEPGLRAALADLRRQVGDPEVAVFNASVSVPGAPTELGYDATLAGLRVGLLGALVTAQELAPAMRADGRGAVLLTGSGVALRPPPTSSALAMQKAALRNLAYALAGELGPDGVHVATVTIRGGLAPGSGTPFDPERVADVFWALYEDGGEPADRWRVEVEITPSGVRDPAPLRPAD
jgi:NAD(P)-dependent dehydrogenase (short-subunit alcohol dehydrogenase family)